jgi:multiple sugar transport system substrate-binding protein
VTLTIWTTEPFSPTQAITSGQILAQQVAAFEADHPRIRLEFLLKEPYGKGGLLDFLLTTGPVVPELLPDLILLDVDELGSAVQTGLIQPLDTLLPQDLQADLYPFARQAATFDGRLYGLQYQADLDHLIYNAGKIPFPPRTWSAVLNSPDASPYCFPAGGKAGLVNDAFLIQYLSLQNESGSDNSGGPFLDSQALTSLLQFYQDAKARGVLPASVANYRSTDDCLNDYLAGQASLAQVSAYSYLLNRGRSSGSAAAPIPGADGSALPISRGWVLALLTTDPARQAAATDLIVQWMNPAVNAAWNQAVGYLPTRAAAMALWRPGDSYSRFVEGQLQQARPRPPLANYTQVAAALQKAVTAVLDGTSSPQEAANQAIAESQ